MIEGSCLCSRVKFQAEGPLSMVARCHCTQCRKASGAEFATNGSVPSAGFRVTQGEALLREYEWSPGEARVFCGSCGSPLFKRSRNKPEYVRLRLGCVDEGSVTGPTLHVFVSEKPSWSEITDALPQHPTAPGSRA